MTGSWAALRTEPDRTGAGPGGAAVTWSRARLHGVGFVLVQWHFEVQGGSFGSRDAQGYVDAVAAAVGARLPVVAVCSSGGARLTEGVPALVGMARARLAHARLGAARLPLLAVADSPTTGGVWVTVVASADLRCAVAGATVGFAGPRVVEAMTGAAVGQHSHSGESAAAAGLVDAVVTDPQAWVARALIALQPAPVPVAAPDVSPVAPALEPWEQVRHTRTAARASAGALLDALAGGGVALAAPHGDTTARAALGRLPSGRPVVGVALAAARGVRVTPDAYRLLTRAAALADRLDLPLVTVVDTPSAEPGAAAEADGLADAIAAAFDAVLACRSPVVGVLLGEGGSGGALAALCGDALLMGEDAYFAVLAPEGAAAALRRTPVQAAEAVGLRPVDLAAQGIATVLPTAGLAAAATAEVDRLCAIGATARLAARWTRWG